MSESTKTYRVKLSKTFHTQVAPGTRLSNIRHSRGGVTLSSPDHVEEVVELTKDQVEAIKNDPAFEITSVSQNASGNSAKGSGDGAGTSGQAPAKSAAPAPTTPVTTPAQGDGSVAPSPQTDPNLAEKEAADARAAEEAAKTAGETGEPAGDAGATEGSESTDGPAHLDEAALKALKKGNRDGAVAAATERNIEVTDQDTKAQIVDKIAASQAV